MSILKPVFINLAWEEALKFEIKLEALYAYYINILTETIPLIIVPGFMGTKLCASDPITQEKITVWDPDDAWGMYNKYGDSKCSPRKRKEAFIGSRAFNKNHLLIKNYDDPLNPYLHQCLSSSIYGSLIKELSNDNNWTSEQKFCFELPVYSFPYNWTDDNANSAKKLALYVEKILNTYQSKGKRCERVLLITHSMGGLVARYACKNFISEKVLGVIHVVQPVNGATSAFWRMKCGFERGGNNISDSIKNYYVARVLGRTSKDVTAVLANMPGGLQLLPNCNYIDNTGDPVWLRFVDKHNQPFTNEQIRESRNLKDLPQYEDPYEEIYKDLNNEYGLINKDYLSPGYPELIPALVERYLTNINKAKEFHDNIKGYSHPLTVNIYGTGFKYPTSDKIHYQVEVEEPIKQEKHPNSTISNEREEFINHAVYVIKNDINIHKEKEGNDGGFKKIFTERSGRVIEITLKPGNGVGDETVSEASGMALVYKKNNPPHNDYPISDLKHDAAMSNYDTHSRKCIERIMTSVRDILNQEINQAAKTPIINKTTIEMLEKIHSDKK